MKKTALVVFMACFCLMSFAPASAAPKLDSLGPAPDFKLQDVYLDSYSLSDFKKKTDLMILFWTTWCPFCQKELKVLNSWLSELSNHNIEVLAIDVGEQMSKIQTYVKNNNLSFKVLIDVDTKVSRSYGVVGVPTYVLIDKEGQIVFRGNYFPEKEYKILTGQIKRSR